VIIDCHSHAVSAPTGQCTGASLMAAWTVLDSSGTYWGRPPAPPEEELHGGALRQIAFQDEIGTDVQVTTPRPFILKHSCPDPVKVHWWCEMNNDALGYQAAAFPDRIKGVGALPQVAGAPITDTFEEFDRVIGDLGFVGVMVNPDPHEGRAPGVPFGHPYWYPLFEKAAREDVPILVHSAGCYGRGSYNEHSVAEAALATISLIEHDVLDRFPGLKIVIPHGGGSVPYQLGRWMAHDQRMRSADDPRDFQTMLRSLWFDSTVYTEAALALLIDTVGSESVLFGTDRPGSAGPLDDVKPILDGLTGVTDEDRANIFEVNARRVFSRL